jgi:hypothetical protein
MLIVILLHTIINLIIKKETPKIRLINIRKNTGAHDEASEMYNTTADHVDHVDHVYAETGAEDTETIDKTDKSKLLKWFDNEVQNVAESKMFSNEIMAFNETTKESTHEQTEPQYSGFALESYAPV